MIIALCDCNNFFVSCERRRDPSLEGRPVIVLSHNDGCVIARSNEAKALNIGMAVPFFNVRGICKAHDVVALKGDHALYRQTSRNVMDCLGGLFPDVEVSSIDEAYLLLTGVQALDPASTCRNAREKLLQKTGIPASFGIAPTKTLAKIASRFAKHDPSHGGVFDIGRHPATDDLLASLPVGDVWGVGKRSLERLRQMGIRTALDLKNADDEKLLKRFSIGILRTSHELRGICCYSFEPDPERHRSIQIAPSFRKPVTDLETLQTAAAQHAIEAAKTLRTEGLVCGVVQVSIQTNPFRKDLPQYEATGDQRLEEASDYSPMLAEAARQAVEKVFKPGYAYRKVGVVLGDLSDSSSQQSLLFSTRDRDREKKLMEAVDNINRVFGDDTIRSCFRSSGEGTPIQGDWAAGAALGTITPCRSASPGGEGGELGRIFRRFKHDMDETVIPDLAKRIATLDDFSKIHCIIPIPPSDASCPVQPLQNLALQLGKVTGVPVRLDILVKTGPSRPLKSVELFDERRKMVRGVFRISKRGSLSGRTVLLLDDVFRSGATLSEAARVLKNQGLAEEVRVAVVAKME